MRKSIDGLSECIKPQNKNERKYAAFTSKRLHISNTGMIDFFIIVFYGSMCILLKEDIVKHFFGVSIKWIVIAMFFIWVLLKICQRCIVQFNLAQKKFLLSQLYANMSEVNYSRLINDILLSTNGDQSVDTFKSEIEDICAKHAFVENEKIFEIVNIDEEKLFDITIRTYKEDLRKRYMDKMDISSSLKLSYDKLLLDFFIGMNRVKGWPKGTLNILILWMLEFLIYVIAYKYNIVEFSLVVGLLILIGAYYVFIRKDSESFDNNINFLLFIMLDIGTCAIMATGILGVCKSVTGVVLLSIRVLFCTMFFCNQLII